MGKKRTKKKSHNSGTTLVELIITFALIGLFMVAATKVISDTIVIYYNAKAITTEMQVSSIISAKLREEVEGARTTYLVDDSVDNPEPRPYAIIIGDEGKTLELNDHTGAHVKIGVNGDNLLNIHYYPINSYEDGQDVLIPASDWTYDKNVYMGYHIKDLLFEMPGEDYADNVIKMTLTLDSPKYGEYTVSEYFECYNFDVTTVGRIGSE